MQRHAESDAFIKGKKWLLCGINIQDFLVLHVSSFMVDSCFNDAITNCLCDDILCCFFAVETE